MFKDIIVKLLKAKWASILAQVFRAAGEGDFGETVKSIYWKCAGKKTPTGVILIAISGGLAVLAAYPDIFPWAPLAAKIVLAVGSFLASVGLSDGLTREEPPQK